MNTLTQQGFEALSLPASLCDRLAADGIAIPTPIQERAIPPIMAGHDLIGLAQTGTGKTLAFALPIAARMKPGQTHLVLAPTRELAQQIADTFTKLGVRTAVVVGGASFGRQVAHMRAGASVIVATPGRLLDHLTQGTARISRVSTVVLDEADMMLDLGFAPAIQKILAQTPQDRQTLLFSATMPKAIEEMASQHLSRPKRTEAPNTGSAPKLVKQELIYVQHEEKGTVLANLLYDNKGSVLVFARTRHGARKLAASVRKDGHSAAEIHADRSLLQRREALDGFKRGSTRVLIATDIAARGIDVKEVSLVINFDVPEKPEDYLHRIGRTGRAGASGRAITIGIPAQAKDIRDIERLLGEKLPISSLSTSVPVTASRADTRQAGNARSRPQGARSADAFSRYRKPTGPSPHGRKKRKSRA